MVERVLPEKSVIVAADVKPLKIVQLVQETAAVKGISGYKIGITSLGVGLNKIVSVIKNHTDLPVIYDHKKAGNDIPETGKEFADMCSEANLDAVILFPLTGPVSEVAWIRACQDAGIHVMVGAHMTHAGFLYSDGGSIADDRLERIFRIAVGEKVTDFVVPGNKVQYVEVYKQLLDSLLGENNFSLSAPGFITQGGEISYFAKVAGNRWHAIVGRAIYEADDMQKAAEEVTKQIR